MKWLVTLGRDIDSAQLRELLRPYGTTIPADAQMIPMGNDVVVEVEGPADLPQQLGESVEVKDIHPSSEFNLY
jgi:hypothetical protein